MFRVKDFRIESLGFRIYNLQLQGPPLGILCCNFLQFDSIYATNEFP